MNTTKGMMIAGLLLLLQGCQVPLRSYRLQHPAVAVPPAIGSVQAQNPQNERDCTAASLICLTFIELDDMGEPFARRNGQLDTVLSVIRRANDQAASPGGADPIVILFIHGWKNNSAPDNGNVAGFKAALQRVQQHYGNSHRVVGVFVSWRGDLIRKTWPVARQLSYYNREATAARVPGAELASMLTQIAARTHQNPRAMVVFIGHSFGGLLLERAVSQAMASEIAQAEIYEQAAHTAPAGSKDAATDLLLAQAATAARADLVIYINPAGAATESKQMLDFLVAGGYRYTPSVQGGTAGSSPAPLDPEADRPLLVSLTSTADLATKLAVPIGHALPDLRYRMAGSFRKATPAPGGSKRIDIIG